MVSANHIEGIGNVIHSAITTDEHTVEKFVLHYKNGETQEIDAKNNTFITKYPTFLSIDSVLIFEELENAVVYDVNGYDFTYAFCSSPDSLNIETLQPLFAL